MVDSLTYNEYFDKWLLVGASAGRRAQARQRVRLLLLTVRRPDRLVAAQADPRGGADLVRSSAATRTRSATRPCSIRTPRRATSRRPAGRPICTSRASTTATARRTSTATSCGSRSASRSEPRARRPLRILVSGMIAAVPHHGGATWAVLQYLLGFARARPRGHVRRAARPGGAATSSARRSARLHARGRGALRPGGTAGRCSSRTRTRTAGPDLRRAASGRPRRGRADQHLGHPDRRGPHGRRAHEGLPRPRPRLQPALARAGHRHALRRPRPLRDRRPGDRHARTAPCPTSGIDWIPTVPPVVLEHWPRSAPGAASAFTTIGNWRGYGSVEHEGSPLRPEGALDARADVARRAHRRAVPGSALDVHPARRPTSRRSTATAGRSSTPPTVARDPDSYRDVHRRLAGRARHRQERLRAVALRLVQRSQRLLPRLRQAGAWRRTPASAGSCPPARGCSPSRPRTTRSPAIEEVRARLRRATRGAAREIAEEHLDSRKVLTRFLERVAAVSGVTRARRTAELRAALEARAQRRTRARPCRSRELERRPCEYRTSFALEELDVDARGRQGAAADVQGPRRAPASHEDALRGEARASCTTRCARSRSTATCSTAPGSAPPPTTASRVDPAARPLLAVHRERRRRRCCGRSASSTSGRRRPGGWRACTRALGARAAAAPPVRCCATAPTCIGVWDRPCARVRRATRARRGERRHGSASRGPGGALRRRWSSGWRRSRRPSSTASSIPPTCSCSSAAGRACGSRPIDWEIAGVGPGLLDLAALTIGKWTPAERARWRAPTARLPRPVPRPPRTVGDEFERALDCCRLHLAVQWLGWEPEWQPPAEHRHDWLAEALALAERLGL